MNIKLNKVSKSYGDKVVIDSFDYLFEDGKFYLLKGESGAGKTTTINLILGLTKPTSGDINGDNRYSVVFQENRLLDDFSVIDNLRFVNPELDIPTISSIMSSLIPGADITKPVKTFSGGMKRRVAIARAILAKSDVVIMDEPFTGLDSTAVNYASEFILSNIGKRTLILTTHIYDSLEGFTVVGI